MADRAVISILFRYVNSNTEKLKEEYLDLNEIVGSKGAESLCTKICEVLVLKDTKIIQLRFHGLDGTNGMSGEHSGLQRRLNHEALHSKCELQKSQACTCFRPSYSEVLLTTRS